MQEAKLSKQGVTPLKSNKGRLMTDQQEKIKRYIDDLDFTPTIEKNVKRKLWRLVDAKATEQQYKNFLFLLYKYQDTYPSLPPSQDIDEFWHNHILDTKRYHQDCQVIFGKYLHHYPYFGIDGATNQNDLDNAFDTTQALYQKEFGDPLVATFFKYPPIITRCLLRLGY